MPEPPSLKEPIRNDDERAALVEDLIVLQRDLASLRAAAGHPLSGDVRDRISRLPFEAGDTPEVRLQRWVNVFNDDLDVILDVRNRLIHRDPVTDYDLRGAVWLARRLKGLIDGA